MLAPFLFIFLSALPGRTTFLLLLLASTGRTRNLLLGAGLAFLLQSAISVGAGQLLKLVPAHYVQLASGFLFLFFAFQFWRESRHGIGDTPKPHSALSVFTVVFLAEFGDVSQLAIATEAARSASPLTVFLVAVAALWLITLGAVVLGRRLGLFFRPARLQLAAAFVFALVGGFLIHGAVAS